jgi:hypothetical protein
MSVLKLVLVWKQSVDAFLEELIIRRELADNFCYYQPHYDTLAGAWDWARKTLQDHASDKREHIYTSDTLYSNFHLICIFICLSCCYLLTRNYFGLQEGAA